ncbi:MAG: UDP-N-acetylmuramate dehydrogenase [Bacilli bacterium]
MNKIEKILQYISKNNLADVTKNVNMSKHTTYKTGGHCAALVEPFSILTFQIVMDILKEDCIKFFMIGNGSNVILPDDDSEVIIIKLTKLCNYYVTDEYVYSEAGILIPKLSLELAYRGISVFEFASGIPGTLGGCIYMNAGAYGKEISDYVISALVYDCNESILKEITTTEMMFSYRSSIFHHENMIVIAAKFKYERKEKDDIITLINNRRKRRVETQPIGKPSAGSVFRNFDDISVWKLVDECGLRGKCIGDACVSEMHSNTIINIGNAKSKDILQLIESVKTQVLKKTNRVLIIEQKIIEWDD